MNKKSDKYRLQQPKTQPKGAPQRSQAVKKEGTVSMPGPAIDSQSIDSTLKWGILIAVIITTFLCYRYSLKNELTNWDDGVYVTENPYIKVISWDNIKAILDPRKNITQNYYHPLTLFSLMANYHYSKLNPEPYYITNIVIHLLNTALVFFFIMQLLQAMVKLNYGKINGIVWLAGLCSLWHGIHPMHVESVSWLAERKDVLYLFFYLLGLITYVQYAIDGKGKWLVYTCLFYLLSLLSKPLAVTFPLSLFALDVLLKRDKDATDVPVILKPIYAIIKIVFKPLGKLKETAVHAISKLIAEKTPIFILSVAAGFAAYIMAKQGGSISSFHVFTIWQRFMFVGYNFIMYFAKAFVPLHLCSFIPYPNTDLQGYLPFYFYLAPLGAILLPAIPLYLSYRAGGNYFRVTLFGFAYYFFNVVFILQFVSAGATIMSERYSYAPYIGIVFMVVYYLYVLADKVPLMKYPVIGFALVASSLLGYLCYDRTKVWHNTKTLWQDVILKYPYRVQTSYKNLGNFYADLGPTNFAYYDSAFTNYETLVKINMADAGTYSNIANIYGLRKQYDSSLICYSKALKLDSTNFDAHLDRAITLSMMKRYSEALKDYDYAYEHQPLNEKLLENRASTYINAGQYANAVADYTNLIKINPDKPMTFLDRGAAEWDVGDYKNALNDFVYFNKVEPNNGQCLFDLAVTCEKMKDYKKALEYAMMAKNVKFDVKDEYIRFLNKQIANPSK
ncbi:MAG: tetratricopeptide repeat protein [Bacteroidia bacterium]